MVYPIIIAFNKVTGIKKLWKSSVQRTKFTFDSIKILESAVNEKKKEEEEKKRREKKMKME